MVLVGDMMHTNIFRNIEKAEKYVIIMSENIQKEIKGFDCGYWKKDTIRVQLSVLGFPPCQSTKSWWYIIYMKQKTTKSEGEQR